MRLSSNTLPPWRLETANWKDKKITAETVLPSDLMLLANLKMYLQARLQANCAFSRFFFLDSTPRNYFILYLEISQSVFDSLITLKGIFRAYVSFTLWRKSRELKKKSIIKNPSVSSFTLRRLSLSLVHFKVPLHKRCGSGIFYKRCDFNRNLPISSKRHCWQQRQHIMFCRLCKYYFKAQIKNYILKYLA